MMILKIKWYRYEKQEPSANSNASPQVIPVDETTIFLEADEIQVHSEVTSLDKMSAWEEGSFLDYHIASVDSDQFIARLIQVERNGKTTWYLASSAWLMSAEGKTIERLVN